MIARIVWIVAVAAVALVAGLAQLDRASRLTPALASLVPAPMQGFAARYPLADALQARDGEAAMDAARRLVKARPAPAEHMSMLAQAASLAGDEQTALAALGAASKRGWRDPVAQLSSAEAALASGAYPAASQRIAAMLATYTLPEESGSLLTRLLASPEGKEAFASQLAEQGRWQANALAVAAPMVDPDTLGDTLARALAKGADLECGTLGRIAQGYSDAGKPEAAALFWPGDCAAS